MRKSLDVGQFLKATIVAFSKYQLQSCRCCGCTCPSLLGFQSSRMLLKRVILHRQKNGVMLCAQERKEIWRASGHVFKSWKKGERIVKTDWLVMSHLNFASMFSEAIKLNTNVNQYIALTHFSFLWRAGQGTGNATFNGDFCLYMSNDYML